MEELIKGQKCRSWEEEMYWKHFNSIHFCLKLHDDFHDRLVLPPKFAENMIRELPDKVSIFGPSGAMWDVTVTKTDNNVAFVGDEWKEFAKAYGLINNSLLILKYKRNVGFEVLIMDPVSLCEKESAYFVKKHDKRTSNINNDDVHEKKRSSAQAFDANLIDDDEDDNGNNSDFVVLKRLRKDKQTSEKVSSGRTKQGGNRGRGKPVKSKAKNNLGATKRSEVGVAENGESDVELGHSPESIEIRGKKPMRSGASKKRGVDQEIVHSPNPMEVIGNTPNESNVSKEQSIPATGERTPEIHAPISENPVHENGIKSKTNEGIEEHGLDNNGTTPLEKVGSGKSSKSRGRPRRKTTPYTSSKKKLSSAKGKFSKEFVSNRRPVTEKERENALQRAQQALTENSFIAVMRPTTNQRFFLSIPSSWTHEFLPLQNHKVVLRIWDKMWPALFYYYSHKGAWLSGVGLKKFVYDNHLEEFDVCLMKLASEKGDSKTVFDVEIFRVIPEIVSPSPVVDNANILDPI